jgi:hypothetical protein
MGVSRLGYRSLGGHGSAIYASSDLEGAIFLLSACLPIQASGGEFIL